MKKVITMFLTAALLLGSLACLLPLGAAEAAAGKVDPTKYTYEIYPLLEPFHEFFYVKTENPDPTSFRFLDRETVYNDNYGIIELCDRYPFEDLFADVVYEDVETRRVKGGYIFMSSFTDGGEISLLTPSFYDAGGNPLAWEETDVTLTLPKLYDTVDYLIHTYAKGNSFFDKMDAVQLGLSNIAMYTGSFVRGEIVQTKSNWYAFRSGYAEQIFYIDSPYTRRNNQKLLATALFPLFLDSKGFPLTLLNVALRLEPSVTYQWNAGSHAYIDLTYGGMTRVYGGAGEGKGQGVSEDKIVKRFTFGGRDLDNTIESLRDLQKKYAAVEMEDDIPEEGRLTWQGIADTVGGGAWVRLSNGFAYFYKKDDKEAYTVSDAGTLGGTSYWNGSLAHVRNAWVDGRYMNEKSLYEPGATFEKHPKDSIFLTNMVYPVFTFARFNTYDRQTGTYRPVYTSASVTERTGTLEYRYNPAENTWDAYSPTEYDSASRTWSSYDYATAAGLAEAGLIDESYVDLLRLTYEEVLALGVDRNTDREPEYGYNYSGSAKAGTPFDRSAIHTRSLSALFADAKGIAEENGLQFRLDEGNYGMCGDDMYWVYLQDSLTLIITGTGEMAAMGNTPWYFGAMEIRQVFVGEGVRSLQDDTFYLCSTIETITLPSTLKSIGVGAFRYCQGLKAIEIPKNVERMGRSAFYNCVGLTDIYCLAEKQPEGWNDEWLEHCDAAVHWGRSMPEGLLGDIDGNGKVNSTDYLLLKRYCLGTFTLSDEQIAVADVSKDGKVNSVDYLLVKRHVLGTFKIV